MEENKLTPLYQEYQVIASALEDVNRKVDQLSAEKSVLVAKIVEQGGKGPHLIGGNELYATKRGNTFFFTRKKGRKAK